MPETTEAKFEKLVAQTLGAQTAKLAAAGPREEFAQNVLGARLPDGRWLLAIFGDVPHEVAEKQARLQAFADAFSPDEEPVSRLPVDVGIALDDELRALASRAAAEGAHVIDLDSPIVWGSSTGGVRSLREPALLSSPHLIEGPGSSDFDDEIPDSERGERDTRLLEVRRSPEIASSSRGRPLTALLDLPSGSAHVHIFNDIYLLVLLFGDRVDELRAARALGESMPRIERLVSALPPLDPGPSMGAVVSLPRRRR